MSLISRDRGRSESAGANMERTTYQALNWSSTIRPHSPTSRSKFQDQSHQTLHLSKEIQISELPTTLYRLKRQWVSNYPL
jgi:hypothetical protein